MMARGAAPAGLDSSVDGLSADAATASELFAVVDLIDGQPMLRRSLSDPSASFEDRSGLAKRLFGARVSASTLAVIMEVLGASWGSGAGSAAAAMAMASVEVSLDGLPCPMAAMRSIQASTPGVASRMPAMAGLTTRVNHSGW